MRKQTVNKFFKKGIIKMKKILCLFLVVLMVFGVVGCGSESSESGSIEGGVQAFQQEAAYNRDEGAKVFENPQIGDVLIDNELVKISYDGFGVQHYEGETFQQVYVNVAVEPKRALRLISYDNNEINEFIQLTKSAGLWGELLKTGKTTEGKLTVGINNGLDKMEPSDVKRIKLDFSYASYDALAEDYKFTDETIVIYPNGKQEIKPQIPLDSEKTKVVYDKDGIQFIVTNWEYSSNYKGDKYIYYNLCIVNNTNKEFHYDVEHFVKESDQENSKNIANGSNRTISPYSVFGYERFTDLVFVDDVVPPQLTIKMTGEILEEDSTINGTPFETSDYVVDMSQIEK